MTRISEDHRKAIDNLYWSPRERAAGIHAMVESMRQTMAEAGETDIPSDWDLLCWAIEYIAMQSVVLGHDRLTEVAKMGVSWLYSVHYNHAASIYGAPDRPDGGSKDKLTH